MDTIDLLFLMKWHLYCQAVHKPFFAAVIFSSFKLYAITGWEEKMNISSEDEVDVLLAAVSQQRAKMCI